MITNQINFWRWRRRACLVWQVSAGRHRFEVYGETSTGGIADRIGLSPLAPRQDRPWSSNKENSHEKSSICSFSR
jgi:hypothetical protein